MKKLRTMALFTVAMLCLALFVGCGSPAQTPDASGDAAGDTAGDAAGEPAQSGDAALKVGILAPLTGEVAQYGNAVRNGARLYLDEVNAAGGIDGKTIEIIEYDEQGDPTQAITGYNSLVDQGITALIGDVTTAPTLAVVPEAFADNMPMITASATAAAVTYNEETQEVYSNMFRSCFIDPFQGDKMASFAFEKLSAKTAAVLFNTGSDYSIGLKDAFVAKAEAIGLTLTSVESYADKAVDFQSQLTNIAAQSPDVLFVPDYYETIALVGQQAKSVGLTALMLGGDGWDTVLSVVDDASTIEGAYYCSGYSPEDTSEDVQTFLASYKAKYNEEPSMFAAQGYDAAMILVDALKKAEAAGLTPASAEYKQAVIDGMKATDLDCVTGQVTYDEFNNPNKTAVIINIVEGNAKFWGNY